MVPAIRSEFRKIATIRSPALLLAAATLIVLAGVSGLVETTRQTPGAADSSCSVTPPCSRPRPRWLHSAAMSPRRPQVLRDSDDHDLRRYLIVTA
ncbi:MAG TPA: hypothetical protein VKV33_10375, partial [Streptosporangiaceae bacterium]|nr:hypothetical protein [Streptosporangiaceae bacterium]